MPDHSLHLAGAQETRQQGFTLIEMLIAVAIIGIVAGIAYPSYTRYVERSLRTDAHAGLLQAASEMERCYSRQYNYTGCAITTTSPDGNYAITAAAGDSNDGGFILTATTTQTDGCDSGIQFNARGERMPVACW
ncbi:type IV pilin protein [Vreelandella lutescens]|uniref:Type IV pilin n=1 Tax=Vreelandella lutescens TaxID=1602943 RepID=A0ABQ1PLQ2_9GAMM|nr:type IV pilin protein [Halomonas lutescens]GGC99401.1 type IV pilin [Halomonas lutescens]